MTIGAVILATALFFVAFQRSNLLALSLAVIAESNGALRALRDASLDDEARERIAQSFALRLFGQFGRIVLATLLVLAAPAAILVAAVYSGYTTGDAIVAVSLSWPFIAANVAVFAVVLARSRKA